MDRWKHVSSSNNTATYTLSNAVGCDSIVTLDLTINNSDNTSSSVIACDEFTWDGQTYTEKVVSILTTTLTLMVVIAHIH